MDDIQQGAGAEGHRHIAEDRHSAGDKSVGNTGQGSQRTQWGSKRTGQDCRIGRCTRDKEWRHRGAADETPGGRG